MEKQFYQRIFMFIASLVIVTNIFCSTHQAYFLNNNSFSLIENVFDSKVAAYSAIASSDSFIDIEENIVELEEESFSDELDLVIANSNFYFSGAILFYFLSGKESVPFSFIKQKFPPLFLILENFRI